LCDLLRGSCRAQFSMFVRCSKQLTQREPLVVSMFFFRLLPWEYAIRNLFRRPLRTALTFVGLTTVVLLVFVVVGFIRGLEKSLAVGGDPQVAIIFALGMGENLEYSSIDMGSSDVVAASVEGIQERNGQKYVSPELYLGTDVTVPGKDQPRMGLVRGVTPAVLLVRRQVEIVEGEWPKAGEILVGRLAATKLGALPGDVAVGKTIKLEGRDWRVSGKFAAGGAAFESEIWCRLDELQQAMKRQDLSLVAVTLAPGTEFSNVELFCMERLDLELQAVQETEYYATLQKDYGPVRMLAWLVVLLVSGAGVFAGLNTMYGSIVGRIRELATLQTIGFARRAMLVSLVQEGIILAAAASLAATFLALLFVNKASVRFTMGAFTLRIDDVAVLIGCGVGLLLGVFGAIPPAIRALRMPIVDGLKST
jgi:putative ABC transport system permease protein